MITLLTDFGLRDGYVGAMKGVIAARAPGVPIVDVSHEIEPQAVRRGGLVWAAAAPWFPPGTLHVGVVDPGVGSRRRILAVETDRSVYLAPDNGLASYAVPLEEARRIRSVENEELFLRPVSRTFHGRDIFAPVAAALAGGVPVEEVGPEARDPVWPGLPAPREERRAGGLELRGEVVDIDRFGNATTSLRPPDRGRLESLEVRGARFSRLEESYAAAGEGRPLVIVGSLGFVEVAVSGGSAARELGLSVGDEVMGWWRVG